jgi:hypothetical protein
VKGRFYLVAWISIFCLHPLFASQEINNSLPIRYSPRPEKVAGLKQLQLSLSGSWFFHPAPPDRFWLLRDPPRGWSKIQVPGDWTMQGFSVRPNAAAGYWRSFIVPAEWLGSRIMLRSDGVQSKAEVWINGRKAGSHLGGFTAFELDITDLLDGAANTIALAVANESLADELASSAQYAGYQIGGITRKMYLMALPTVNIASLKIETDFDRDYSDALLRIRSTISNEGKEKANGLSCIFSVADEEGRGVPLEKFCSEEFSLNPGESAKKVFEAKIQNPRQWDGEHPNLYVLAMQLKKGTEILEAVKQRFGFREVEVVGNQVFVNGRPIKVRGVNRHETHPLLGRSLNPDLWRKDAELFRNANINYIRTSHYPPAEEFLDFCDELGLFVELEAPLVWVGHGANTKWENNDPHAAAIRPLILQEVSEAIAFNWNHPSVIFWSLANESAWGPNWAEALRVADALDSTRPKTFHDQAFGEYNNYGSVSLPIANFHYPGPQGAEKVADFKRPILFGEYCHINTYNRQELVTDPGVRDDYGQGFSRMWEKMLATRACLGGAIWCGIDDIFYLPSGKTVGYGPWGIIDGWRRVKPEYWHVKKTYSPVRVHTTAVKAPPPGEPIQLQVSNRHDFSNLDELEVKWQVENESGEVRWNLPPHETGILKIYPKSSDLNGKRLKIDFSSRRGFLIDTEVISIGEVAADPPAYLTLKEDFLELEEEEKAHVVTGRRLRLKLDKASGQIQIAAVDNHPVLSGGPTLMILSQSSGPCQPDFSLDAKPLNDPCGEWQAESVEGKVEAGVVVFVVKGKYKEAEGEYTVKVDPQEGIEISYAFVLRQKMNPRQYGMVLELPGAYDTLNWKRRAQWSSYPKNHIGRPEGTARASIPGNKPEFSEEPRHEWPDDQNALGTNDFRSTKSNAIWASLTAPDGYGLLLHSEGRQACRSFLNGEKVGFFIADFSTGGGDMFFASHHQAEDRPLAIGDIIKGSIQLKLIVPKEKKA